VSIGAVLDEAWTLYTKFFLRFFVLALVVFAAVNLLYALIVEAASSGDGGTAVWLALVGLATTVIGTTWLQGALVYAVRDARDGSFDSTLGEVFSRVAPFIVPGLFLLTIWAVIAPVIVLEKRPPLGAFGRSRELVRGHGWTVFGIVIVTGLLTGIASGLLQAAFSFLPRFLEIFVGGTIAQAVVAPFSAIALAVTYFRLRDAHGGEPAPADV